MRAPVIAEENVWYQRWLLLVWVISPVISISLLLFTLYAAEKTKNIQYSLYAFDFLHMIHFITDLFAMDMFVDDVVCEYIYIKWRKITMFTFYADLISLLAPLFTTILSGSIYYNILRILRIYGIFYYHKIYCTNLASKTTSTILKIIMLVLMMHAFTILWITMSCQSSTGRFPVEIHPVPKIMHERLIDYSTWGHPLKTRVNSTGRQVGCPRITSTYLYRGKRTVSFLVPRDWRVDYLVSLTYMTVLMTNTNLDFTLTLTALQNIVKIIIKHFFYLIQLWISSVAISVVFAKYRDQYQFDYKVSSLIRYLKANGISVFLQDSVKEYTKLLWRRQKGNWLPEITHEAPLCLREDILSSLYMHHLLTPSLFQHLPMYFLRQLAVKLKRVVIFPGKSIVQEGDVNSNMYFIHEGEVEKWYTDPSGDSRMSALLVINGYFGLITGLFPNTPYQFTYITRTVVDLVYLNYNDWQELLDGYPELKANLYIGAMAMKKDTFQKVRQSKSATGTKLT